MARGWSGLTTHIRCETAEADSAGGYLKAITGTGRKGIPGGSITFVDAETLIDDFFDEVGRVLAERGIDLTVTSVGTRRTE
jgi:hypothetical protein